MTYDIVIIDDERIPPDYPSEKFDYVIFRTSDEALAYLQRLHESHVRLDELWLDYDLGEDDTKPYGWDTIMPVVYWLEEQGHEKTPLNVGIILIHTQNYATVPAMMSALRPYYVVARADFPK